MKKLLVASAIALFGLSNAQIAKGTTYITGQVGYEGTTNNNNNESEGTFSIVPNVGYFVDTNVAVGLGIGYTNTTAKATIGNVEAKDIVSAFVVEPYARKYWNLGEKLYIFGQLSVPMAFGTYKEEKAGQEIYKTNVNSYGVVVAPGLDYFINKNWSIEATIGKFGYQSTKVDVEGAKNIENYGFGLDLNNIKFGVKYIFGAKEAK